MEHEEVGLKCIGCFQKIKAPRRHDFNVPPDGIELLLFQNGCQLFPKVGDIHFRKFCYLLVRTTVLIGLQFIFNDLFKGEQGRWKVKIVNGTVLGLPGGAIIHFSFLIFEHQFDRVHDVLFVG